MRGNKGDNGPDARVALAAGECWGVLSLDELSECGLSRKAVASRARRGHLHRLHRGVYAVGHRHLPLEGLFLAAVKACGPHAVLSHFSAAAAWGLLAWGDGRRLEVTVRSSALPKHALIHAHRTLALAPQDVRRKDGIRLTSPARTVIDIAGRLSDRGLRRVVRQGQGSGVMSTRQLCETLDRCGPRSGSGRIGSLVATGPAPTRSDLEDIVLDLILRGGFEHPDVNIPLWVAGHRIVPDFRWAELKLIVEADSAAWHQGPLAELDDAERQALLEAQGERVVRVSWDQAVRRPRQTVARLERAGAPQRGPLSP